MQQLIPCPNHEWPRRPPPRPGTSQRFHCHPWNASPQSIILPRSPFARNARSYSPLHNSILPERHFLFGESLPSESHRKQCKHDFCCRLFPSHLYLSAKKVFFNCNSFRIRYGHLVRKIFTFQNCYNYSLEP